MEKLDTNSENYLGNFLNELALKRNGSNLPAGLSFDHCPVIDRPAYAFVDWLKATQPDKDIFTQFCKKMFPYLKNAGFDIYDTGKGMNGYSNSFAIEMNKERVGTFAADFKMGGLFELTGQGCNLLQANWGEWTRITWALSTSSFRITRLDVSTDLSGVAWQNYNITLPKMLKMVHKDDFLRVGRGQGNKPSVSQNGDWSDIISGDITADTYRPYFHAPGGLSFNVGSRTSVNSFIVYEKGKEQFGKGMIEKLSATLSCWVRVERRFTRGSGDSKVVIPWEFVCLCDQALFYNCPSLEKFLTDYHDWKGRRGMNEPQQGNIDLVRVGVSVKKRVLKKAYWASMHAGKLMTTLKEIGFNYQEIFNMLSNPSEGIKGYVDDITDKVDIQYEFMSIKRSMCHV